jgi:hypothetical protein
MWPEKLPVEEWERVIADATTQQTWMLQSDRKMQPFQFQRTGSPQAH